MNQALKKLNVVEGKQALEARLGNWINGNTDKKAKYGDLLNNLQDAYRNSSEAVAIGTYYAETFNNGIEIVRFANIIRASTITDKEELSAYAKVRLADLYKDYEPELDRKVMPALLKLYSEKVPAAYLPSIYETINKKFKGDYVKYANWVFEKSKFTDINNLTAMIIRGGEKDIRKDPAMELAASVADIRMKLVEDLGPYYPVIDEGSRKYIAALMDMEPEKTFYPDANFTQRLSYGSIAGYKPADAVEYNYYSTTKGVLEKENPTSPEFTVQNYILDNLSANQWGQYADEDGTMHVGFLSTNDITGGNSGSPVFNGKAELIGLAFDGNWEALSGDIVFEPELQRTISVDIRYVLYTIDKIMNCPRLIKELELR